MSHVAASCSCPAGVVHLSAAAARQRMLPVGKAVCDAGDGDGDGNEYVLNICRVKHKDAAATHYSLP